MTSLSGRRRRLLRDRRGRAAAGVACEVDHRRRRRAASPDARGCAAPRVSPAPLRRHRSAPSLSRRAEAEPRRHLQSCRWRRSCRGETIEPAPRAAASAATRAAARGRRRVQRGGLRRRCATWDRRSRARARRRARGRAAHGPASMYASRRRRCSFVRPQLSVRRRRGRRRPRWPAVDGCARLDARARSADGERCHEGRNAARSRRAETQAARGWPRGPPPRSPEPQQPARRVLDRGSARRVAQDLAQYGVPAPRGRRRRRSSACRGDAPPTAPSARRPPRAAQQRRRAQRSRVLTSRAQRGAAAATSALLTAPEAARRRPRARARGRGGARTAGASCRSPPGAMRTGPALAASSGLRNWPPSSPPRPRALAQPLRRPRSAWSCIIADVRRRGNHANHRDGVDVLRASSIAQRPSSSAPLPKSNAIARPPTPMPRRARPRATR